MSESAPIAVLRHDRVIVLAALTALVVLSWTYLIWLAEDMSTGLDMSKSMPVDMSTSMGGSMSMPTSKHAMNMLAPAFRPWSAAHFAITFAMWTVMMVGMMTPSVAPMILIYARVGRDAAHQGKPLAATGFFAGGYFLAWAGFSLAATTVQWMLDRAALLTSMIATANETVGGLVLIAAGLFQWTPLKDVCLRHCQAPLRFIQQHGGFRRNSLGLGFRHGLYCVGCCWALMALLLVGGVMNLIWVAGLTVFVLLEKIVPSRGTITRAAGAALIIWGSALLMRSF
jgi:predicted metal-binding membrane protein